MIKLQTGSEEHLWYEIQEQGDLFTFFFFPIICIIRINLAYTHTHSLM